jgi:hypothetical protein
VLGIDAHEMTPTHFWGDIFGPAAGELAELAVPLFKKTGGNDFYNPTAVWSLGCVPSPPVRVLRKLRRYRKNEIDVPGAEIARLEKVLKDGIKLTSVASKVLPQSGRSVMWPRQ